MKLTFICEVIFITLFRLSRGNVVIRQVSNNLTVGAFESVDSSFGPDLDLWGMAGYLLISEPLRACSPISSTPAFSNNSLKLPMFVLIERGNCSFEQKVIQAQKAGFSAAIIYNNMNDGIFEMGSNSNSQLVEIPSVMVGMTTGLTLKKYLYPHYYVIVNSINYFNPEAYIIPFLIVIVVCFFLSGLLVLARICRDWRRRQRNRLTKSHLKKIPEKKFVKNEDPYETCAICLDDYLEGDKLRILPCGHAYHSVCIDPWLLKNKRVCPVCKKKIHIPGAPRSSRTRSNSNSTADSSESSQSDSDNDSVPTTSESTHLLAGTSSTTRNSGTFQNSNVAPITIVSVSADEAYSSIPIQIDGPICEGVENPSIQIEDEQQPVKPTASSPQSTHAAGPTEDVTISTDSVQPAGSTGVRV